MNSLNVSDFLWEFLPFVGAVFAFMISFQFFMIKLEKKLKQRRTETTPERINRLSIALQESIELTNEIQAEIEKRHSMAAKLQSDVERFEKLADLKGSEVEAIAQTLRGELRNESTKSFFQSALLSLFFFIAGIAVTLYSS